MTRTVPAPEPNVETQPFWDAAAQGKLLIRRCNACGEPHYYPRALCPFCLSADTRWEEAGGTGAIYSLSTMRRGKDAPYTLAYVVLDEGPAVLTNIDADPDDVAIGQRVRVGFVATEGGPPVPMFVPISVSG
ncbi:Zn-ribbon domain-containing OB-fold protein [Sphingomonas oligophenolica]|uniref:DNA-binding protein n=1 Tax=Sphingomonas oligophenolica TaxID=301154 RepID=A0A502BZB9_9SPHN|nr:OB-fold domain-containing protein [Sphingomonas oligophenolica]TPG05852.1 DNA-binding protein [Sphingomonas oligophenolica]